MASALVSYQIQNFFRDHADLPGRWGRGSVGLRAWIGGKIEVGRVCLRRWRRILRDFMAVLACALPVGCELLADSWGKGVYFSYLYAEQEPVQRRWQ